MRTFSSFLTLSSFLVLFGFTQCSDYNTGINQENASHGTFNHLLKPGMTKFEKAVALRRAIADTLDVGFTSDSLCLNFAKISFQDFNIDSFIPKFGNNTGAGSCGLASSMLAKTLNDAGIEAYTYNFGFENTKTTHVLVIAHTDNNQWTVHDPSFNYSITDSSNNPKDFFKLLGELGLRNHSDISFSSDTVFREVLLDDARSMFDLVSFGCLKHLESQHAIDKNSIVMQIPVCYSCVFDSTYCPELNLFYNLSQRASQFGLPRNSLYGFLFQLNRTWGPNPTLLQAKIDSVFKTFNNNALVERGENKLR
ncbi:MAG: hypothetical protein K9G46_07730 [Flavobacteriales bacterium]|nr:hypothetical protein [Flavobacteriales bacterium]